MTEQSSGAGGPQGLPAYPLSAPRRGRGRALAASAVGVAAILAAATFAITAFGDDRPSDPESAVEALFAAVEDRDVLGVLDSFAPGERDAIRPFVEDLAVELQRVEVLSEDLDLASVEGFDLEVRDLVLSSRDLADGMAVVSVEGGTLSSTVRPADIPLGPLVRGFLDEGMGGLEAATTSEELVDGEPVELVVIEDDGWHVSLGYTIAEAARAQTDAPLPVLGGGVQPAGEGSPEDAAGALFDAAADLDVARLIALLPPGEMSALHDYAPLFLADAEAGVAELLAGTDVEVAIDRLDTEVDEDGGVAEVTVTGFAVSGQVDGEAFAADFDGDCVTVTAAGTTDEQCVSEMGGASALAASQLTLVVVEVDGAWYLSPLRTGLHQGIAALRMLQPEDLRDPMAFANRMLGANPLFGSGMGMVDPSGAGTGEERATDDVTGGEPRPGAGSDLGAEDPFTTCAPIFDELPDGAPDEEWEQASEDFDACLDEAEAEAG